MLANVSLRVALLGVLVLSSWGALESWSAAVPKLPEYTAYQFDVARKAAAEGNPMALNVVGMVFSGKAMVAGTVVAPDDAQALAAFRKAAEKGYAPAQNNLAVFYYSGRGVPRNYGQALRWFERAAEQGHVRAQVSLAGMYTQGQGTPQDMKKAAKWFEVAARKGDAQAANSLGFLYDQGEGRPRDIQQAIKWYRRSAELGYAEAQNNLGLIYLNGLNETAAANHSQAMQWFRKAADQGFAPAQANLAQLYAHGHCMPANYLEAYFWMSLAQAQGGTSNRDEQMLAYAKRISAEERDAAAQRVRDWKKSHGS